MKASMFSSLAECKQLGAITEGYESFWAFNEQKGVAGGTCGVAVWVRKDLAKGIRATQKVFKVDDFDQEGRCLLVDWGSLALFNVYVPVLKGPEDQPRKLKFLELLRHKVEEMQSAGKMVIVCGDFNLTWRPKDFHGLYVKVVEDCVCGKTEWRLNGGPNRSALLTRGQDSWIRLGEAQKALQSELLVSAASAELRAARPPDGAELLRVVDAASGATLWMKGGGASTPLEIVQGLDGAQQIRLQFGVPASDLAAHGQTYHSVMEPECVEFFSKWLETLTDTFAACHGTAERRFTCWMQRANMRYSNKGSRLDYILCDQRLLKLLVSTKTSQLAGATADEEAQTPQAAWNAATHFGRWHGAHQVQKGDDGGGLSLQQDDMRLNDSQFRAPHTGILYTPPKYSDHVPVSAVFEGLDLAPQASVSVPVLIGSEDTRGTQPWTSQATLGSFFVPSKRPKRS